MMMINIINKINDIQYKYQWQIFFAVILISIIVIVYFSRNSCNPEYTGLEFQRKYNLHKIKKKIKCKKLHEKECRRILEKIFNKPFPSIRPDFLRNPETGKNLELDCFNSEHNLAVEYQGILHTKYTPYFHKSHNDFLLMLRRDIIKKKLCEKYKIHLIEVPHTVKFDNLETYLRRELKKINKL